MLRKTFWVVQGGPGSFLGHPGGVQEASWGVLGLSGGVRGASWEGLGRSWGDLGATFKAVRFRIDFLIDFERQKGAKRDAFGEPKWSQNRSQNDSKSKSIFKSEKTLFKTVLEPPWAHLAPFWVPSWAQKKNSFRIGKRSAGAKSTFLKKISLRKAS